MKWPDGRAYEGYFENNYKHGHGVLDYGDGRRYVGDFVNGKLHGHGTLYINEEK